MPYAVTVALTTFSLFCLFARLKVFRDPATLFFVGAIWLRYALGAYPQFTYPPLVLGLSLTALFSIAVALFGLLLLGIKSFLLRQLLPIYLVVVAILISGLLSGRYIDLADALIKWCYLAVMAVAGFNAMKQQGPDRLMRALLVVFLLPLSSQAISFLIGAAKTLDEVKGISYVGSYGHESQFSAILLTYIIVTCFAGQTIRYRLAMFAIGFFAVVLANYRTAMLAAVPVLSVFPLTSTLRQFAKSQRFFVAICLGALLIMGMTLITHVFEQRFSDLTLVLEKGLSLIKPPSMYTNQEQDIFTARAYIWANYIYAWMQGSDLELLFGYGPDSWRNVFRLYAHNTFVSYLYEFGLFGLSALIYLFASQIWATRYATTSADWISLFASHSTFLLLCLGTMPLWQIEGVLLYAILLAHTWFRRSAARHFKSHSKLLFETSPAPRSSTIRL